jgi:hypothetical protein
MGSREGGARAEGVDVDYAPLSLQEQTLAPGTALSPGTDHFVGARHDRLRNLEHEYLRYLEIDDQFELLWVGLERQTNPLPFDAQHSGRILPVNWW